MPLVRRARGAVLRLVRRRGWSAIAGALLVVPAIWIEYTGSAPWWASGAALICGATGAALLWTAIAGVEADWVE